jgi:hypothetical protein
MAIKTELVMFGIVILLFLSGCIVETAYAPEAETAEAATAVPTTTFTPNTAVIFKRAGGIAGLNEEWTIFTNGRIESNTAIKPQLSPEQVSQLLNSLQSAGFFSLDNSYLPEDSCCDRFLYEVTAVNNTTFHTVTTLENTPDMPEALQQTLRLIQITLFENSNNK